jgi:hypothetical protein
MPIAGPFRLGMSWSTAAASPSAVKALEKDAIDGVVTAEAAEGREVPPEEIRAALQKARIDDEERQPWPKPSPRR